MIAIIDSFYSPEAHEEHNVKNLMVMYSQRVEQADEGEEKKGGMFSPIILNKFLLPFVLHILSSY